MAFLLPSEFKALADQEVYSDFDESEYEEMVAQLTFEGFICESFVDGKPMSKMFINGGASVNLMPYTTFCNLGKGQEDLIKTDMMLKDFGGNASKTKGQ